jgi:hypothetical protein
MIITSKEPFAYSRIQKFHTVEEQHQKAQILIEKIMNEIDSLTKRPTPLRLRAARVSAKVGVRVKRIRVAARKMRFRLRRIIKRLLRLGTLHIGY